MIRKRKELIIWISSTFNPFALRKTLLFDKMERQAITPISVRGIVSRTHKELSEFSSKKQIVQLESGQKT